MREQRIVCNQLRFRELHCDYYIIGSSFAIMARVSFVIRKISYMALTFIINVQLVIYSLL